MSTEVARLVARLDADIRGFQRDLNRAKAQLDDFDKSSSKLSAGFDKIAQKGAFAAKVGVAALGAAVVGSVKAFSNFDDAMNQSISIMGNVSDKMRGDMSAAAREVGKTTRFSATEAAESFFFLASAGLDAEQSMAAMPKVAKFAQAGMFSLARATDLATDAQSALGLKSKDAQKNLQGLSRVTDVLVKANTLANATVEQFSEALTNKAGAALKILGKDMEEGVAVLAAFADQGVKGSEAGEKLNIVLRDLQTASLNNRAAFDDMGIAVFDAQGEMRNIADVIGDMEGAFAGMSDEELRASLMLLGFQDRSVSAILTLMGLSDEIRNYESALRGAGGTTEEVADKQLQSFAAQLDIIKGQIVDFGLSIGAGLAPIIQDAFPRIIEGAKKVALAIVDLIGVGNQLINFGDKEARTIGMVDLGLMKATISMGHAVTTAEDFVFALLQTGRGARDYAVSLEHMIDITDLSRQATNDLIGGNDTYLASVLGSAEAVVMFKDLLREHIKEMDRTANAARLLALNTDDVGDAASGADGPVDELADGYGDMADAADEAYLASKTLHDFLRGQTDPMFKLLGAIKANSEAHAAYDKAMSDSTASAQELEDAAVAVLQAELDLLEASAEFSSQTGPEFEATIRRLGEAFGIDADILQGFIDKVKEADGMSAEVELTLSEPPSLTLEPISWPVVLTYSGGVVPDAEGKRTPATTAPLFEPVSRIFRQHGGPFTANQPLIVGERGPEMLIPDRSGMVDPQVTQRSESTANSVTINQTFERVEGDNIAQDIQMGLLLAEVQRFAEGASF
jgi:TP901 family phage tail tape measure protein